MRTFADGSTMEIHDGGGMTFDGPTAVGLYRLIVLKKSLKWEVDHPEYGPLGGIPPMPAAEQEYREFSEREGLIFDNCDPAKPHPFGVGKKARVKALEFVEILLENIQ